MLALGADKDRYFAQLLPSLCFNRYDVAEGVSVYSQATWRQVMGNEGRSWVARCLPQVTRSEPCTQMWVIRTLGFFCMQQLGPIVRPHPLALVPCRGNAIPLRGTVHA